MSALAKIQKYLETRSTGATSYEIAKYAKVNHNTARKLLYHFTQEGIRKCRVVGKPLTTYGLA